jgi:two-component system phosphate regulon response regulator PhoB
MTYPLGLEANWITWMNKAIMNMPRVLIAEDEYSQREILKYNFESSGFLVQCAEDGEEALVLAEEFQPNLIILDWMMPKLSGIKACRQLRASKETRDIPIIILSARSEEMDKVHGLEAGADDYVTKPYSINEIIARAKSKLRRSRASLVGEQISYGDILVDASSHKVFCGNNEIKLGPTEFKILSVLIDKPGQVFSRDSLLDLVWGQGLYIDMRTIDVHIGRLRKALAQFGDGNHIRTVRGVGYSLG